MRLLGERVLTDVKESQSFSPPSFSTAPGKLGLGKDWMQSATACPQACPKWRKGCCGVWPQNIISRSQGLPELPWAKNCNGIAKDLSAEVCRVSVQG